MSDEQTNSPDEPVNELDLLKDRARLLGIPIGGNIGAETLKQRIKDKLAGAPAASAEPEQEAAAGPQTNAPAPKPLTKAQREQMVRDEVYAKGAKLVRCRIYCLDPAKRDLQGEIITVGNKFIGTVKKFIPYGEATDNGYHIPQMIYNDLKRRKFQQIMTKTVNGQIQVKTRLVPAYNIEVLRPLTTEELNELAMKQAAAERLGSEA